MAKKLYVKDMPEKVRAMVEKALGRALPPNMPVDEVKAILNGATGQYSQIDELKKGPKEIPEGSDNLLGPFFQKPLKNLGRDASWLTPQVLQTKVATHFNETAFIALNGNVDFADEKRPETKVMRYLFKPTDAARRKEFNEAINGKENVAVRAALYEALARASIEVSRKRA